MGLHTHAKQPPCPVPDSINALHDGGVDLGPLYLTQESCDYPATCNACAIILGLIDRVEMQWPPIE